jgi:hypothetical protein
MPELRRWRRAGGTPTRAFVDARQATRLIQISPCFTRGLFTTLEPYATGSTIQLSGQSSTVQEQVVVG